MRVKVVVYPKDANPYQETLYKSMSDSVQIYYLGSLTHSRTLNHLLLPLELFILRLRGFRILHLHWFYPFSISRANPVLKEISELYLFAFISLIKTLGFGLVWTVHNIVSHEETFTNDLEVSKRVSQLCDKIIVHSKSTLDEMKELRMKTEHAYIIPIGIDAQKIQRRAYSQYTIRNEMNIKPNMFMFLFFGQIREYKGVDKLISTFKEFSKNDKDVLLIIAGENKSEELNEILRVSNSAIQTRLNFQSEDELSKLITAADYTVLPYKKVTTSSTALHSLALGRPVIAPRIGPFLEFPATIGHFYDPTDKDGLLHALEIAKNDSNIEEKSNSAKKYALDFGLDSIAKKTLELYKSLL